MVSRNKSDNQMILDSAKSKLILLIFISPIKSFQVIKNSNDIKIEETCISLVKNLFYLFFIFFILKMIF
jgi:hypothetical protein